MSVPQLQLDFVARPRSGGWPGVLLLVVGGVAVALAVLGWQDARDAVAGLEVRIAALTPAAGAAAGAMDPRADEDARAVRAELATPWGGVLDELESAAGDSGGSVALLALEPDRERHAVRITGEARDLSAALAYARRLQRSPLLRHAMLASHEVRTEVRERPVRFALQADWEGT